MNAGKMRHRITIQSPIVTGEQNPFTRSQSSPGWTDVATVWSDIQALSKRDPIFNSGAQNMQVSHTITIRYPGTTFLIGAGYQVLYTVGGITRMFSVLDGIMNEGERNRQLVLYAWEINPNQGGIGNA